MTQKIFISHTTEDDPFVAQLRKALEKQGLELWVDSQNLCGGDILKTEIKSAIKAASAFIVKKGDVKKGDGKYGKYGRL